MGGSSPHDVFKALGPAEWGKDVPIDAGPDSLRAFMNSTFAEAQCILDSIPVSTGLAATSATTTGRPRASTDSSTTALPGRAPQTSENAKTLHKDWKEVKVGPAENPLGMNVYKMSGKDGRGAWFARRSLHEGLSFERWKLGMEREFAETMKLKKNPGSGNIRGIGAERCIENISVEGCGKAKVYQLSAQFPGPTTPRDFVTLMLTTDSAIETPAQARYFMVVSKPCIHPESPQRSGYIRGHYESVEFIREIKINKPLRRTQSSIDTTAAKEPNLAAEAAKAALSKNTAGPDSSASRPQTTPEDDGQDTMIEWLMITRSDPGGSVPRFMVERGTPSGICGDADKFLKWVSSKNLEDFDEVTDARDGIEGAESDTRKLKEEAENAEATATMSKMSSADPTSNVLHEPTVQPKPKLSQNRNPPLPQRPGSSLAGSMNEDPSPQGFYGVIANAVGMVTSRLPNPFGSARGGDTDMSSLSAISSDISDDDDSSSILSFHSVEGEETNKTGDDLAGASSDSTKLGRVTTGASDAQLSINSTDSKAATAAVAASSSSARNRSTTQHEKDLLKLEQRQRKMEEKYARDLAKRAGDSTKDESAIAKLKEKHDRHKARQEDKYQRELRKLASRREAEQKKAERRKQKVIEKQEKSDLGMEMERIRAERDVARKQIEILKEQVGDLQSQNTLLVARLGREGITINPSKMQLAISGGLGVSSGMVEGVFSDLSNGRRPVGASSGTEARGTKGGSLGSSSGGSSLGKKGVITNAADPGVQVDGPACMMREQPVVKGEA